MPVMKLKDKRPNANRIQNRGVQQTGIRRKRCTFTNGRNVTCALRGDKAKRTLRGRSRPLSAVVPRRFIGSLVGSKATEDKFIRRTARRHSEPNARHHRLDRE